MEYIGDDKKTPPRDEGNTEQILWAEKRGSHREL